MIKISLISYKEPIRLDKIGPRRFKLVDDLELFGVKIPKGYETDGASVPRLFWNILSPFTEGFRAAVVHDYRYSTDRSINRIQADIELWRNLGKCGVNIFRRTGVFCAVLLFGWWYYYKVGKLL